MADSVNAYFASFRENSFSGWSSRLLLMGTKGGEESGEESPSSPFDTADDSVSASGRHEDGPTVPLIRTVGRVNARYELLIFLPAGGHTEREVDEQEVVETLENRGHPSVDIKWEEADPGDLQFKKKDLLPQLVREARASCWGLSLNNLNYTAGAPISSEEAQELHIKAGSSGYDAGAFKFLLAQRGLISAKEVTKPIQHKIRRIVESETMAKIYNKKYENTLDRRNHRAVARNQS
jgi:hypothetical protein